MKMKRTKYDAPAPILMPCSVDVGAVWKRKQKETLPKILKMQSDLIIEAAMIRIKLTQQNNWRD